ncbi:hypothetical protein SUGI_1051320 [Cryptomeria japonica]|uniref:F-box protein At3g54460 n=1 Tax=Cryptomeria japonica TaxID=3369 RepID=UPI002414AED1|nr:F-box protein At3g54460 [Cryptomeria japonica]GLJ49570.1 hypothetical protein SUGI_1051320 [Cryptomeria japonica]
MRRQRGRKRLSPVATQKREQQYKLCGFLHASLAVNVSCRDFTGSECFFDGEGADLCLRTEAGVTLLLTASSDDAIRQEGESPKPGGVTETVVCVDGNGKKNKCSGMKRRRSGLVKGSRSILHELQALVSKRLVQVKGLVVGVSNPRDGEFRAVVLFDVYLPLALWSDPQFWRPGSTPAAVLSHLSCDWGTRSKSILAVKNQQAYFQGDDQSMWNPGECHVLGCELHCKLSESKKRAVFDLHEVFKSLPTLDHGRKHYSTSIKFAKPSKGPGIWDVPHDVLTAVLSRLMPRDLFSVSATCHHLRSLAVSIMPCMNVKLFPHQQVAVEWMLQRERSTEVMTHPLYRDMVTEDGFQFYINLVSGEVSPGMAPTVTGFRGGMFCDEPGLGKTVTALSLVLKTQGTLADPPEGMQVKWCDHSSGQKYGYYEISASNSSAGRIMSMWNKCMTLNARRNQVYTGSDFPVDFSKGNLDSSFSTPPSKRSRLTASMPHTGSVNFMRDMLTPFSSFNLKQSFSTAPSDRYTRSLSQIKRNLLATFEEPSTSGTHEDGRRARRQERSHTDSSSRLNDLSKPQRWSSRINSKRRKHKSSTMNESDETWVQCDACSKWRKLPSGSGRPDDSLAWFCSMNRDVLRQNCSAPEENWDTSRSITSMPGFHSQGTSPGQEQNICFFTSILKEYASLLNSETKQALTWLANLTTEKLSKMETTGVTLPPGLRMVSVSGQDLHGYYKIFQAFGLVQRKEGKGITRWCYPRGLLDLVFDVLALKISLTRPVDVVRLYLSRATLIVVPANLVEHWKNQILKHIRSGQVRLFIWVDQRKPPLAHNLAWDYDIVITTFPRLSAEWSLRESSVLMRVHWLRVILDEGHTLGSSLNLTNKLQMAISLTASCRWLLTGTPMPNTPNSQVAHLQPMLKFLHEEAYGLHPKSWESGILRPFEAELEEGRSRLVQLLQRCMISARKADLKNIPACIKKVTFLHFTEEHAKSYNELVVTVRRNILMADWNDPSHVESLLNPKQWKFRSNTIRNVRLSCCVAGHIKVKNAGEDIQETMDILVQQGLDPSSEEYVIIKHCLLCGGNCFRCQEWCRLPIITPCRHLLCLDCVALDSEKCTLPGCTYSYKMQSPEIMARPENPNPKWPVPQDLIELQPSYNQDSWDPDWHATTSSKVAYLVERLKSLRDMNRQMGYCLDNKDLPKDMEEVSEHKIINFVDQNILGEAAELSENSHRKLPEKAIIFSQFLEHIHVVERQLTGAGIGYVGMYSPMHSSNKVKSLITFQKDIDCMVLIMDGSAALGLDLSFVTHVFLMEPIWDRSMEEQVISRAHRMGATRPIHVETLAMRGTIEEQMLEFLQDPVEHRRAIKDYIPNLNQEGQKCQRTLHDFAESNYLAQLSFVRTKGAT